MKEIENMFSVFRFERTRKETVITLACDSCSHSIFLVFLLKNLIISSRFLFSSQRSHIEIGLSINLP